MLPLVQEILKKCDQSVAVHREYEANYAACTAWIAAAEDRFKRTSDVQVYFLFFLLSIFPFINLFKSISRSVQRISE